MLPLRSDCAQRKHTSCNISFYKAHKSMQAYPCAIVMHVLTTCFRCAPIVLNVNTLRVTFHFIKRTSLCKHKVRNSNARLATCFRCAPIVLNANTLCVTFHLFYRTIYASIKCAIVMHVLRRASVPLRLRSTQTHFV